MDQITETKLKSFWEKPEGKTGLFGMAALIGGGLLLLYKLLPWMITLATNTLHLMLLLGAIGGILFLITNPQVRNLAWVTFQLVMRKITSFIIKIDPLEILKMKVREMEDNLERVATSLGELKQVLARLKRKIDQNQATLQESIERASYAKQKGEADQIYLLTRKAGRMEKSTMTLQALFLKIETMHKVLSKIHKNSAVIIADTKDEIEVTEQEYLAVRAAHGAMKSAMSIISGDKDKRAIYEEAYEVLSNDIANKSGEIEQMIEMSESLMKNIDLDQGMMQEKGLKMIDEWEKKADSWLVSTATKNDAISKVSGQPIQYKNNVSPLLEEVVENTNNQFGNLFKN
jgi:phage shock protein A